MHRSRDEDIVLRPTDEFYANASETLRTRAQGMCMCMCMCSTAVVASQPSASALAAAVNAHEEMITRLEWELQERKALVARRGALQGEVDALRAAISQQHASLDALPGLVAALLEASRPACAALRDRSNATRAQNALAGTLPDALYAIYCAATAYARAHGDGDAAVSVEVAGSALDGEAYERETRELLAEPSPDMDAPMDVDASTGGRHEDAQAVPLDRAALLKPHPMTVEVSFGMPFIHSFAGLLGR
jgi:hypothetical protein